MVVWEKKNFSQTTICGKFLSPNTWVYSNCLRFMTASLGIKLVTSSWFIVNRVFLPKITVYDEVIHQLFYDISWNKDYDFAMNRGPWKTFVAQYVGS